MVDVACKKTFFSLDKKNGCLPGRIFVDPWVESWTGQSNQGQDRDW